ncbi:MAG: hypothetical protein AB3N16_02930 [Flavobacteriaceae bacterium]
MGGEGSMMHAIKSLQANRALRKKRKSLSEIRDSGYTQKGNDSLVFKKVDALELKRIKKNIQLQMRREARRKNILSLVLTLLFILVIVYLVFG